MAAAVVVASPVGARFERSVLRGIYPGRANEVDRCLNSKGIRRHGTDCFTYYSHVYAGTVTQPTACRTYYSPHHTRDDAPFTYYCRYVTQLYLLWQVCYATDGRRGD